MFFVVVCMCNFYLMSEERQTKAYSVPILSSSSRHTSFRLSNGANTIGIRIGLAFTLVKKVEKIEIHCECAYMYVCMCVSYLIAYGVGMF